MNKVVMGVAALAAVAAGGVGVSAYSGGQFETEFKATTEKFLKAVPRAKRVSEIYTKGLMNSTHELTLDFNGCDDVVAPESAAAVVAGADAKEAAAKAEPFTFILRNHIHHGPVPGGKSVGLASIDTEIIFPAKVTAELAKVFGDKPALKAHTVFGFGGGYTTEISSPAIKYSKKSSGDGKPGSSTEADFDWQGLTMTVRGNDRKAGVVAAGSYEINIPGLMVDFKGNNPNTVKLGRVQMRGDMSANADLASSMSRTGTSSASVASVEVNTTSPADGKPFNILFNDIKASGKNTLDKGRLSSTTQMTAKGVVAGFAIDKIEVQGSLNNLDAATYQKMATRIVNQMVNLECNKKLARGPDEFRVIYEQANRDMAEDLTNLLRKNLEYSLDKLVVEWGGKQAELSYKAGTRDAAEADAQMPMAQLMATKGYMNVNAKVPRGWIEHLVKGATKISADRAATKPSTEELEASQKQIMGGVDMAVGMGEGKGVIVRDGETFKTELKFEKGALTLNGKPLDPAMMGGLLPGMR
jgi:uncharacterized protein YdgA (DUF945 family)